MRYMDITPEIASEWLANNNHGNYRAYRPKYASYLAKKMTDGFWQRNGVPIVFDTNGELKDGQHRLGAIVESGITLKDWPVEYVDPSVTVFDMGRTRTWNEYTQATNNGRPIHASVGGAIYCLISRFQGKKPMISSEEKLKFYWDNEELLDQAALLSNRGSNHGLMKRGGCIAALFCALKTSLLPVNDIENFCRCVNSGFPVDGYACEAALALRRSISEFGNNGGGQAASKFCFETTWQALIAFKRGLRSRRMFKGNGCADEVVRKALNVEG